MKNKNIFIISLFQLFYNIFSYKLNFYCHNNNYSIKELNINGEIFTDSNKNFYEGDLISGTKISIKLDKNITDMTCVHVIGFINYTDVNDNKISTCINFLLEDYEDDEVVLKRDSPFLDSDCEYSCFNITDDFNDIETIILYGYVPLKCGNDRNFSVIIAKETDISSYFKEFFDSTNDFYLYYTSTSEDEIGLIKYNGIVVENSNYYTFNRISFLGAKYGQYKISFKAFVSNNGKFYDYTTTKYPCNMTINICWKGCKTCKGVSSPEEYQQFCYECIEGYSFNLTDEENRYGNCFESTFEFDGYFEKNGFYEKCNDNCQKCSITESNCTECKTNYYKRSYGDDDYCYEKKPDEYLTEDNELDKCYIKCETCSKEGNETTLLFNSLIIGAK